MALNTNQSSINQMIQSINVAVDVYLDCFALCCRLRCRCFSTWTQIYWMTRGWTTWTTSSCPTLSFHPRTRKLNTLVNRSCHRMPPREEFFDLHGGRDGEGRVWLGSVPPPPYHRSQGTTVMRISERRTVFQGLIKCCFITFLSYLLKENIKLIDFSIALFLLLLE